MPMYVVRSYLPYDTVLNFNLVDNNLEPNTVIQAKSAINLNNIQHIDLPGTMKEIYNLTIQLKFVNAYINVASYFCIHKKKIILVRSLQHPFHQYLSHIIWI